MSDFQVKFIKTNSKAIIPKKAKQGDAGYDLFSPEYFKLAPFERKLIPIGLRFEFPEGFVAMIRPKSGLALKKGIDVMAGVIDSGYRDNIGVVLINLNGFETIKKLLIGIQAIEEFKTLWAQENIFGSQDTLEIKPGDPIAQIVFKKYFDVDFVEVQQLTESDRGLGGFGSTHRIV